MVTNNDKHLGFVLKHYRHGALDTRAAMKKVLLRTGTVIPMRYKLRFAVAMVAILLLSGAVAVWHNHATGTVELAADGAIRTVVLPDSTQVTLRKGSSLTYKKNSPRSVMLNGTAYFQVRHDAEHPFTVANTISTVRVLGTKFAVESERTVRTEVYVTEGKVLFCAAGAKRGVVLTKGMKARLDNGDAMPERIAAGSINQTAWATGVFHFAGTPLREVLNDLSAYYGVRLYATKPDKRLTGDIHADSLNSVIQLIEQTLGVDISVEKE